MTFFTSLRQNRVRPSRTIRKVRPAVEGCESRLLMSGATISGTTFNDLAGNGSFSDDVKLPGVTVDLYRSGSKSVFEQTVSDKNGNYSFANLAPGGYTVQQVLPKGFIPTGANFGYSDTLKSGQDQIYQDFEDFQLNPLPVLSKLSYTVTTPAGKTTTVSSLDGTVQQGDSVTARFTVKAPAILTLVAYSAPNGNFDTSNIQKQVIFSEATTTMTAGSEMLKVKVPDGFFQLDFVAGPAIDHLDTNANVMYKAQDRFIDGESGGTGVADPIVTPDVVGNEIGTTAMLVTETPAVATLGRKH